MNPQHFFLLLLSALFWTACLDITTTPTSENWLEFPADNWKDAGSQDQTENDPRFCGSGQTRSCYTGPPKTQGIYPCHAGKQTCQSDGTWGECVGQYLPQKEECDNVDNDCNGQIDESCPCSPYQERSCIANQLKGECRPGKQRCAPDGSRWGECIPNKDYPGPEECNGKDDDCDGLIDNIPSLHCYPGDPKTANVGICRAGETFCKNGAWTECTGIVLPQPEICDDRDNNCDGRIDENFPEKGKPCFQGIGECRRDSVIACRDKNSVFCKAEAGTPQLWESCDGKDNNCDGQIDEGLNQPCCQTYLCCVPTRPCCFATRPAYRWPSSPTGGGNGFHVALHPNMLEFAVCKQKVTNLVIEIRKTENGSLVRTISLSYPQGHGIAISEQGDKIAVNTSSSTPDKSNTLLLIDYATGKLLRELKGFEDITNNMNGAGRIRFSPKGTYVLATTEYTNYPPFGYQYHIGLWQVQDGQRLWTRNTLQDSITEIRFSNDESLIAIGHVYNKIEFWHPSTGGRNFTLQDQNTAFKHSYITGIHFHPNNKTLAAIDNHGIAQVWDLNSFQLSYTLSVPIHPKSGSTNASIQFSPNGNWLVAALANNYISVWDTTARRLSSIPLFTRPPSWSSPFGYIWRIRWSSDSTKVLVGNDEQQWTWQCP